MLKYPEELETLDQCYCNILQSCKQPLIWCFPIVAATLCYQSLTQSGCCQQSTNRCISGCATCLGHACQHVGASLREVSAAADRHGHSKLLLDSTVFGNASMLLHLISTPTCRTDIVSVDCLQVPPICLVPEQRWGTSHP